MKNTMTYKNAFEELSKIIDEIDSETTQVDKLSDKINRAVELIEYCQTRLRSTEEEFNNALKKLEK